MPRVNEISHEINNLEKIQTAFVWIPSKPQKKLRPLMGLAGAALFRKLTELRSVVSHLADVFLRVEFEADLLHDIELGFEEVDMAFLVLHQILEQLT